MMGTAGLCLLAVCIVWTSASPTVILRSRYHSNTTVTPKHNTSPKNVTDENQSSVSLFVILNNLKNCNESQTKESIKNQTSENTPIITLMSQEYSTDNLTETSDDYQQYTESPSDTPKYQDYDTTGPVNGPDENQSSESPTDTLKRRDFNNPDSKEKPDENQSSESPTDTLKRRDFNNPDSKEEPDENQSSESPSDTLKQQDYNNTNSKEEPDENSSDSPFVKLKHRIFNKLVSKKAPTSNMLTPAKKAKLQRLERLLLQFLRLQPDLDALILQLAPVEIETFDCTSHVH